MYLGGDKGRLFINEASLAEFKHNPAVDGKIVFKVDEEFQFGQANKKGKDRFLVFHNKNNTIYQVLWPDTSVRFVTDKSTSTAS